MPLPKAGELFFGIKLTSEQREYADSIFDNILTICNAKAGTGKSTVAVGCAKLLNQPLYYLFSCVEEKTIGFTTGDKEEKESKYLTPLYDALTEIGDVPEKVIFDKKEFRPHAWVHATSHTFLRGANLKNATIIIDEAQNFTVHELRKTLTRIHDSCTVILIGHHEQCDLPNPKHSGFVPFIEHFKTKDYANIVQLTKNFRGRLAQDADEIYKVREIV
jgi:phosphate starvation-inducible protein PhoH